MHFLVLDCETLHSAAECTHCAGLEIDHVNGQCLGGDSPRTYTPIGWNDYARLGLSIGCYYDSAKSQYVFFDRYVLTPLFLRMRNVDLLVTFNGRRFDVPLLLAQENSPVMRGEFQRVLDTTPHYDILHEIWQADPASEKKRGNSLAALAEANHVGVKTGRGELAPVLWRQGKWAEVINYCRQDVEITLRLFGHITFGEPIMRGGGLAPLTLPMPREKERGNATTDL